MTIYYFVDKVDINGTINAMYFSDLSTQYMDTQLNESLHKHYCNG